MTLLLPLLAFAGLVLIAVPISLYYAWAASWLWLWFVVPPFNAPTLTVWQLWGITLTLSMLRPKIDLAKNEDKDWGNGIAVVILGPLLTLGFGYAIKCLWM